MSKVGGIRLTHGPKLHVGCGTRRLDGYINIDPRPEVQPEVVATLSDLPQIYGQGQISEIYMCHVLEHFEKPAYALYVCHKLLSYHGVLRLAVPSLEDIFGAYNAGVSLERLKGLIWGRQDYAGNHHFTGWDFETLANDLRKANFYDVKRWFPHITFGVDYHDFSYGVIHTSQTEEYMASLNVEAKRI